MDVGCFTTERGEEEEIICVRRKTTGLIPFPFLPQFSLQHFRYLLNDPPPPDFLPFRLLSSIVLELFSSLISPFLIAAAVQFSFPPVVGNVTC